MAAMVSLLMRKTPERIRAPGRRGAGNFFGEIEVCRKVKKMPACSLAGRRIEKEWVKFFLIF